MVFLDGTVGGEQIEFDDEFDVVDQLAEIMHCVLGEGADEAHTWIIGSVWEVGIELRIRLIMEQIRVRPEVVHSSVHAQLLMAAKQTAMMRSKAPSKPGVQLNPFLSHLAALHHLLHQLEGKLWFIFDFEDPLDHVCATEFCAHWSAALLGFFAKDEFYKLGERAVGIVHGLFEDWHSAAEEGAVVFLGGLREVERVLDVGVFVDLLKELCGETVDRHLDL